MDTGKSATDELRHVKFAGRPAIAAHRPSRQTPSEASPKTPVSARRNEPPRPFISWVFHRAGLSVECYRGEALQRRESACLRALHAHTEEQARQALMHRPELLPAAVSSLLIGTTQFFRDESVFQTLQAKVLPDLVRRGRPLRVWSVGCSSGEELYSMAMLLDQAGLLEGSCLLGSDCRRDAIEQARVGLYGLKDLKVLEAMGCGRYFEAVGGQWRPINSLRRHIHWKVSDLTRHIEPGPWDIILWRNMGIYLTPEAAESAWRGLMSVLAPEGVLVAGKASRPPEKMHLTSVGRCIYRASCEGGR